MDDQQNHKLDEKAIRDEYKLDQEHLSTDMKLGDLLEDYLARLASQNPDAHNILLEKIRNGFFEESHGRKALNDLADQVLQTVKSQEKEDEIKIN
ncbi:hypothetical protein ACFLZW_05495 [Chloroflexota bacterium]